MKRLLTILALALALLCALGLASAQAEIAPYFTKSLYETTVVIGPERLDTEDGYYSFVKPFVAAWIANMAEIEENNEGMHRSVVVTCTQVSGPAVALDYSEMMTDAVVAGNVSYRILTMLEEPADVEFRLTAYLGSTNEAPMASTRFIVHYVNMEYPGNTLPDELVLYENETSVLAADFDPPITVFSANDHNYAKTVLVTANQSDYGASLFVGTQEGSVINLRGQIKGECMAQIGVHRGNVHFYKEVPVKVIEPLRLTGKDEVTCVICPLNSTDGPKSDANIASVYADNYVSLNKVYGVDPTWTVTYDHADEVSLHMQGLGGTGRIMLDAMPDHAMDVTATVEGVMGDAVKQKTVLIHFVEAALPTGLAPEVNEITMQVGDTLTLTPAMLPGPMDVEGEVTLSFYEYGGPGSGTLLTVTPNGDGSYTVRADTAGETILRVNARQCNVTLSKRIPVTVTGENGEISGPTLTLQPGMADKTLPCLPLNSYDDEGNRRSLSMLTNRVQNNMLGVQNYAEMKEAYGGEPEFTMTLISGVSCQMGAMADSNGRAAYLVIQQMPEQPGEAIFNLTCTWGGQTQSKNVRLTFVQVDPTLGMDIPDVVHLTSGESVTYSAALTGSVPGTSAYATASFIRCTGDTGLTMTMNSSRNAVTVSAASPGAYHGQLMLQYDVVMAQKEVLFLVDTEGDFVPMPQVSYWLNLPADTLTVEEEAFAGDEAIQAVAIPANCRAIGSRAFAGCTGLVVVSLPADLETIAEDAFADCPYLAVLAPSGSTGWQYAVEHRLPIVLQ